MMTVMLSVATATFYGVADFIGGLASRRVSAIKVTAVSHAVGATLFTLAVLVVSAPFSTQALVAGAISGIGSGIGVAALYAGLARGRMSVIAPLTAALSGSLPAIYDVSRGATLSATSVAGLGLALVAIVVVSVTAKAEGEDGNAAEEVGTEPVGDSDASDDTPGVDDDTRADRGLPAAAIGLALVSGVAFSVSFIGLSLAPADSGFWPLFAARIVSVSLFWTVIFARGQTLGLERSAAVPALSAGLLDAAANVTMLWSIRLGPLSVAAVIGALYPVATVLLARVVLGERLRGIQLAAVGVALVSVVLAAMG